MKARQQKRRLDEDGGYGWMFENGGDQENKCGGCMNWWYKELQDWKVIDKKRNGPKRGTQDFEYEKRSGTFFL